MRCVQGCTKDCLKGSLNYYFFSSLVYIYNYIYVYGLYTAPNPFLSKEELNFVILQYNISAINFSHHQVFCKKKINYLTDKIYL